jgi:chemotaxis protein MotA
VEISTIIGLILGLGLLVGAYVMEGGTPASLLAVTAGMIVFGGTLGATLIAFPLSAVMKIPKLLALSIRGVPDHGPHIVEQFVEMAEKARREGLLALESDAQTVTDAFMRKGMMLAVDGTDPELVQAILEAEIDAMAERHEVGIQLFEAMGGYAPTMGVIGTVMGLVVVLGHLSEPEKLGHSIAVAFIATLYGVATANIIWLPISNKLKSFSKIEQHERHLIMQGVLAVQSGDNPRIVRDKLEAYLPPARRGRTGGADTDGDHAAGGGQARAA